MPDHIPNDWLPYHVDVDSTWWRTVYEQRVKCLLGMCCYNSPYSAVSKHPMTDEEQAIVASLIAGHARIGSYTIIGEPDADGTVTVQTDRYTYHGWRTLNELLIDWIEEQKANE